MDKEELRNFLDSMVSDNSEQAQVHFHSYLEDKMRSIVNPTSDVESDEDDKSSDKKS